MGSMTKSGWCLAGNHAKCPHVMRFSSGVWAQRVCTCDCHPATQEVDEKREAS